jgi:hypothetical protein
MQETLPGSHAELDRMLQAAGADSDAAEAHGLLCGITCAGGRVAGSVWVEHLLGENNTLSAAAKDCTDALASLQKDILRQFNDDALGFALLLPHDDEPLALRTRAFCMAWRWVVSAMIFPCRRTVQRSSRISTRFHMPVFPPGGRRMPMRRRIWKSWNMCACAYCWCTRNCARCRQARDCNKRRVQEHIANDVQANAIRRQAFSGCR